jgi:hypothetical protein
MTMWWRVSVDRFAMPSVGAAPHPPAGTFSPWKNGEKFAVTFAGSNPATLTIGEIINEIKLLPVLTGRRCRQADEGQRHRLPENGAR